MTAILPTRRVRRAPLLGAVLALLPVPARAQQNSSVHPTPSPTAAAARREGAITIDGRLDEAAWQRATPITGLRQYQPDEGAPATLPTEVRVLYDGDAIYVGARMSDPLGWKGVHAPLARRDQLLDGSSSNGAFNSLTTDKIAIALDPYHNHQDQAWFEINPAGVRGDAYDGDDSWDPVWEGAAHVDSAGWTAEMRIPYSQLRFSRDSAQTWGLQLWRYVDRLNERDMWSFYRKSEAGGPSFYGHLTGLRITDRPRQFELLPYAVSRGQFRYAEPGDPYHRSAQGHVGAGADLKYLLTSNLTLDATFNPDFGQVEVDPASLNLSAFETYYDEKRPFFVAGRNAFDFGGMGCMFCSNTSSLDVFYSRRIGRPPQLAGYVNDNSVFDDVPDNTTILGAGKITGRTKGNYTVGLLDAVTGQETARYVPTVGDPEQQQMVEPLSNYFVGRVKRDFRLGATSIGAIATSTARRLDGDPVAASLLRSHAEALGLDWNHQWHRREYSWMGSVVASNVAGSREAIARTQRSSAHYFQRLGRGTTTDGLFDTRYDTTATALRGYGFYTRVAKDAGDWLWELSQNWRSPGFEVNDLAFLDRADYKWMSGNLARQWTTPTRWYRSMFAIVGGQQAFTYDGLRTDNQQQAYYQIEFPNYWRVRTFGIHHPMVDDDRMTRGGPAVKRTGYNLGMLELASDARKTAVFKVSAEVGRGIGSGTHSLTFQPGVALKPAASVFIQLSPTWATDEDVAGWVDSLPDPSATAFGGERYVFAFLRTRLLSLDTRVNWTMSPTLTLQLFAQPFFASGDYTRFREFAAPGAVRKLEYGRDVGTICAVTDGSGATTGYDLNPSQQGVSCNLTGPARDSALPYHFGNPNFSYRSLRGTAVLRWEYRPGSTIFFVWTQQREGDSPAGDFQFHRDYSALFRDRPDNVFLVKATYWIGR